MLFYFNKPRRVRATGDVMETLVEQLERLTMICLNEVVRVIRQAVVSWNAFDQDTQYGIIGGTIIIVALILIRRYNKKQRVYREWTPSKPTRKTDGIIAVHFKQEPSSGYRTGNREYDNLVDYYSTPGTLERIGRKKKGNR